MSGHSRWSTIKRKKAISDSKRAKGWTKLLKEVTVAARNSSDPDANPRLRSAIDKARGGNVPNDTIERALKKAAGELGGEQLEELTYQVYGPSGVAILIDLATDNRNRTASELRKILEKGNAKIDPSGSVLHKFKKCGQFIFSLEKYSENTITEVALDANANDVVVDGDSVIVLCEPSTFQALQTQFLQRQIKPEEAEVTMIPELTVELSAHDSEVIGTLLENLEEHEDVLNIYSNAVFDASLSAP